MYRLVFIGKNGQRLEIPLREGGNTIGRSRSCEVRLNDPACSRRHAEIVVTGRRAVLRDLGSENDTLINNVPAGNHSVEIKAHDVLIVGKTALTVEHLPGGEDEYYTMVNSMQARRPAAEDQVNKRPAPTDNDSRHETCFLEPAELPDQIAVRQEDWSRGYFLEVFTPGSGAKRYLLHQDPFTIGRSGDNHLVLSDRMVSGHHAVIRRTEEGYVIEDLQSRNGLFVNNRKVQSHLLVPNKDTIQMGDTRLRFFAPQE